MRTAFLFDLDDTIFDHRHSRRMALGALATAYQFAGRFDLKTLETIHERHLQATYALALEGRISSANAHRERMKLIFAELGIELSAGDLTDVAARYRCSYDASRRAVPGSVELARALKKKAKIAIITNGPVVGQREKIELCGLDGLPDAVVISEAAGVKKPSREIFELTLKELGVDATEALMIGDSWNLDVLGARNAGIPAVWFNRYEGKCPDPNLAVEVTDLEPLDRLLPILENTREEILPRAS